MTPRRPDRIFRDCTQGHSPGCDHRRAEPEQGSSNDAPASPSAKSVRSRWRGPEDPLLRAASIGLMLIGVAHIAIGLVLLTR